MKVYEKIAQCIAARENCRASGNAEWFTKWTETIRRIERCNLPGGSGFDSHCTIQLSDTSDENALHVPHSTADKIVVHAPFHAMDSNGYYCGWYDYVLTARPAFLFGFTLSIRGRDCPDSYGLKDYVAETIAECLQDEYPEDTTNA